MFSLLFYFQDLYKVTPAFEILTKGNTQIQASQKPGVPVDSKLIYMINLNHNF
jgi:hypothetical protein